MSISTIGGVVILISILSSRLIFCIGYRKNQVPFPLVCDTVKRRNDIRSVHVGANIDSTPPLSTVAFVRRYLDRARKVPIWVVVSVPACETPWAASLSPEARPLQMPLCVPKIRYVLPALQSSAMHSLGVVRIDGRRQIALTTHYIDTFFDVYLKDAPASELQSQSDYPEIEYVK